MNFGAIFILIDFNITRDLSINRILFPLGVYMDEKIKNEKSGRNLGLDITRILAFFSVVGVHFFLNTDFYKNPIVGYRMYLLVFLRTSFMICVPLFLLLTGYLVSSKEISMDFTSLKKYYAKIIGILISYALSMVFVAVILSVKDFEKLSIKNILMDILAFKHYAWYVNMYLGLFFLSPFLNLIWHEICDKRVHMILLAIFLALTILPSVFNVYDLSSIKTLNSSKSLSHIVPDWWINLFPITYYYIGAYMRKYLDFNKIKAKKILLYLLMVLLVNSCYNVLRSKGGNFQSQAWNSWGSLENTLSSTLFFILINSSMSNKKNNTLAKFLSYFSSLTFSAYLLSAASDKYIYAYVNKYIGPVKASMVYMPLIVLSSALTALILASLVERLKKTIRI